MNPYDQTSQEAQAAMFIPGTSLTTPAKQGVLKPVYIWLLAILLVVVLLIAGYFVWRSYQITYGTNGQRVIKLNMNHGSLTPNQIDVPYNQGVSIVFAATNQATPEEVIVPGYKAQTTVAQYSTTNLEFTASMKGTFPIYRVDNGIQYEIGKVVVQ